MSEAFAAPEATLHLWTGTHTQSGTNMLYVENASVDIQMEWQTDKSLSGTYRDHLVGRQATLSIGAVYAMSGSKQQALILSATAVHFKLTQQHYGGSAGYIFYSGRIDNVRIAGALGQVMTYSLNAHANIITAF